MIKKKLFVLFAIVMLMLTACETTPKPTTVVTQPFIMYHPAEPTAPLNPSVDVKVITTETIKDETAYVGFEYNEWLRFAQWMHEYKQYQHDLKTVIELYKKQDPALKEPTKEKDSQKVEEK